MILIESQRISLMYLKGSDDLCLFYPRSDIFDLVSYLDADYAGELVNRKSTSDIVQYLGTSLSRSSKKQNIVALSTVEAEYVAAVACCS